MLWQFFLQLVENIASPGVREDAPDGTLIVRFGARVQLLHGTGGQDRHGGMEQVAQFALSLLETYAIALLRIVISIERMTPQPRRSAL